jgi:hypothetical protein
VRSINPIPPHDSQQEFTDFVVSDCAHGDHLKAKLCHVDRSTSGRSGDSNPDLVQNGKVLSSGDSGHGTAKDINNVNPKRNDFCHLNSFYWGAVESGGATGSIYSKALIIVAAEQEGKAIGRIRMARIPISTAQRSTALSDRRSNRRHSLH